MFLSIHEDVSDIATLSTVQLQLFLITIRRLSLTAAVTLDLNQVWVARGGEWIHLLVLGVLFHLHLCVQ